MKSIHIDDLVDERTLEAFKSRDNSSQRMLMKKFIQTAINNDLNKRQRECLEMRYFKNYSAEKIAGELNIDVSTVYKHIKKGISKIKKSSVYLYMN